MPISKYFGGHGSEVMKKMKEKYGKRGEQVFYATAAKSKKKEYQPFHTWLKKK